MYTIINEREKKHFKERFYITLLLQSALIFRVALFIETVNKEKMKELEIWLRN